MIWDRTKLDGVDISTFQPEQLNGHRLIDWVKAVGAGVKFGFARTSFITDGKFHTDGSFPDHATRIKGAGVAFGAYHFFAPNMPGRDQARRFIDALGDRSELACMADVEASAGCEPKKIADELEAFLEEVDAATSKKTIFYSYPGFIRDSLREEIGRFATRMPWIAHYGPAQPSIPRGFSEAAIWQAQGNDGRVDGFPGAVDRNVLADGVTLEDLRTGIMPKLAYDLTVTRGVQSALRSLGYEVGDFIDGALGARTAFAVSAFQKRAGLTPDGVVGEQTRAELARALAIA